MPLWHCHMQRPLLQIQWTRRKTLSAEQAHVYHALKVHLNCKVNLSAPVIEAADSGMYALSPWATALPECNASTMWQLKAYFLCMFEGFCSCLSGVLHEIHICIIGVACTGPGAPSSGLVSASATLHRWPLDIYDLRPSQKGAQSQWPANSWTGTRHRGI